jgi:DNA polymerase-3 subunit delta
VSPAKVVPWRAVSTAPVILVSGSQDFFADRAIKSVRAQLRKVNEDLEVVEVSGADYVGGQLFDLASAGLFGDSKLVVIDGVERCTDALITDAIEYISHPSDDAVVVFRHNGKSVRGKKLLETIRTNDAFIEATCLDVTKEAEKIAFVENEFSSKGRKIQKAAAQALVDIFSSDFEELAAAASQLQLDDAGEISPEIVEKYFGGRLETTTYKVADAAFDGQVAQSLLLLRHALDQGAEPVMVIFAFGKKMTQIAKIYGNPKATAASMGMPDWLFTKTRAATSSWTEEGIAKAIHAIADTDFAVKGGEKDSHYALERLVGLIANKGRS